MGWLAGGVPGRRRGGVGREPLARAEPHPACSVPTVPPSSSHATPTPALRSVRETFEFAAECQSRSFQRGLLAELQAREAAAGVTPDADLDAFMTAQAFGGRHSLAVELMLHMLDLNVCADTGAPRLSCVGEVGRPGQLARAGQGAARPSPALHHLTPDQPAHALPCSAPQWWATRCCAASAAGSASA